MWLCTEIGKHLTSDPADGLKSTLSETPAHHRRGGAVRVGGIPEPDGLVWAAALYSPDRDQQFLISSLPHT